MTLNICWRVLHTVSVANAGNIFLYKIEENLLVKLDVLYLCVISCSTAFQIDRCIWSNNKMLIERIGWQSYL